MFRLYKQSSTGSLRKDQSTTIPKKLTPLRERVHRLKKIEKQKTCSDSIVHLVDNSREKFSFVTASQTSPTVPPVSFRNRRAAYTEHVAVHCDRKQSCSQKRVTYCHTACNQSLPTSDLRQQHYGSFPYKEKLNKNFEKCQLHYFKTCNREFSRFNGLDGHKSGKHDQFALRLVQSSIKMKHIIRLTVFSKKLEKRRVKTISGLKALEQDLETLRPIS